MEMNLHLPQSVQTENELIQLASVPTQIISPKDSSPIISIVQDVCLGVYRLTKDHIRVTEKQLFNLLANNSRFVGQVPKPLEGDEDVKKWSGKQVLSTIMPPTVNLRLGNNLYDPDKNNGDKGNFVVIENGEIKQGVFDKKIYQNTTSGLIHTVFNECGPDETRKLFDNTQRLICDWLVLSGFSVGVSDLIVDPNTSADMKKVINEMKAKAYEIIRSVHNKTFENKTIQSNAEAFEDHLNKLLNEAREKVSKVALKEIQDDNRMINMIRSKSKGNSVNVAQMIAALGQQNVEGKRIAYGFDDRTLPHFTRFDDGPEARGFVENSFIKGLSPQEFFFHAMGGREGLIDTAVKTSSVGYIQRKLVKAMEDCKINYDLTVRNAGGNIVQFLYGEDGMSSTKLEAQVFMHIESDLAKLEDEFFLSPKDDLSYVVEEDLKQEFLAQDGYTKCRELFHQILDDRDYLIIKVFNGKFEKRLFYPISFMRIVRNAESMFHTDKIRVPSDLSPLYVLETLDILASELKMTDNNAGNKLLGILLRCNLSPKQMVVRHRFNKMAFDWIVQQVRLKFYESIAHPSEMVGVVAAQSIGEPSTQLSALGSTRVMVMNSENKMFVGTIANLIDDILAKNPEKVVNLGHKSVVMDLDTDYKIVGVSDDEKTSWKRISQISRHPANGGMVRIHTESGKSTCATLSHSFLKRTESKIVPVLGSDLKVGDRVPVAKFIPKVDNPLQSIMVGAREYHLDRDFGWFCGAYVADGRTCHNVVEISKVIPEYQERVQSFAEGVVGKELSFIHKTPHNIKYSKDPSKMYDSTTMKFNDADMATFLKESFGTGAANKFVGSFVFQSNLEFIAGFLGGYFDGDGNVNGLPGKQMIRTWSVSERLTDDIILLLAYHGIFASKGLEIRKEAERMNGYTALVSRKYASLFKEAIGLTVKSKAAALEGTIEYVNRDNIHSNHESIDKIPCLGEAIAYCGKTLELPGQSRLYGRWLKKESVGRTTLLKYIHVFEEANATKKLTDVAEKIEILKQATYSDVVWDKIERIEYLPDPKEYVYDFTVPGNDSFMVDTAVLVHNTLNTFHSAGVSSASKTVRGVPRLEELLRISKNIKGPSITVYLKDTINKNYDQSREVRNAMETTYIKDIIQSSSIYYNPDDSATDIDKDIDFLQLYKAYEEQEKKCDREASPWLLRLEMDKGKMYDLGLTMEDVHFALYNFYEDMVHCVFSDDNAEKLVFRIRLNDVDTEDMITKLTALEQNIMENVIVKGIKGVHKAMLSKQDPMVYNTDVKIFQKSYEWVITTDGTNLRQVLALPEVDASRTVSNDVHEIYNILGIEATRQALINEIMECLAGVDVGMRHIALLADVMTLKGGLLSIDRHGINRSDIGPLAKCSFEETSDMLIKAGMFAEYDAINGVSANIMLGQIPPCGTGDTIVLMDPSKLADILPPLAEDEDEGVETDMMCMPENVRFDFKAPVANSKRANLPDLPLIVQ
jgi:DNA-directed RNA polymerase beta' subunit